MKECYDLLVDILVERLRNRQEFCRKFSISEFKDLKDIPLNKEYTKLRKLVYDKITYLLNE